MVGKRFMVADVECYGVELCEPWLQLQLMTRPGLITFFSDMSVFAHFGCHARSRAPSTYGDAVQIHLGPPLRAGLVDSHTSRRAG
ncbi:MAG TPA: hypothetical protein VIF85_06365 [Gaiellaceae bacterium]